MKFVLKVSIIAPVACLLASCSGAANEADLREFGAAALGQFGDHAELLAACGPFSGDASDLAPDPAKLVAFVKNGDEYFVVDPFVLVSHPPVTQDEDIVAVDEAGNEIPNAARANNVVLTERTTSAFGSDAMTITVYSVAANGAPDFDQRETYSLEKGVLGGFTAAADISVGGITASLTAECMR